MNINEAIMLKTLQEKTAYIKELRTIPNSDYVNKQLKKVKNMQGRSPNRLLTQHLINQVDNTTQKQSVKTLLKNGLKSAKIDATYIKNNMVNGALEGANWGMPLSGVHLGTAHMLKAAQPILSPIVDSVAPQLSSQLFGNPSFSLHGAALLAPGASMFGASAGAAKSAWELAKTKAKKIIRKYSAY